MTRELGSEGDTGLAQRPVPGQGMAAAMQIDEPILKGLLGYWERLRAGREVPYRSEIDPRQFEDALEHMFILEHLGDGNIRIRLAGMSLCEMMGMELRGMSLRALMRVEDRGALESALAQVLSGPAVGHLSIEAHTPSGATRAAEMLLLPLRSDFGDISRILGCLRVKGLRDEDGTPLRFSIREASILPVVVRFPNVTAMPGMAEPAADFEHAQPALRTIEGGAKRKSVRRKNHLRLVDKD
jgi:hypothetical protein